MTKQEYYNPTMRFITDGSWDTEKVIEYDNDENAFYNYRVTELKGRIMSESGGTFPSDTAHGNVTIQTKQLVVEHNEPKEKIPHHTKNVPPLPEHFDLEKTRDENGKYTNIIKPKVISDGTLEGTYIIDEKTGTLIGNIIDCRIEAAADSSDGYSNRVTLTFYDLPIDITSRRYSYVDYEELKPNPRIKQIIQDLGKDAQS